LTKWFQAEALAPPLKFEIRRAELVSAGICGLKFKRLNISRFHENHYRKLA
jgi:hypothetical protein